MIHMVACRIIYIFSFLFMSFFFFAVADADTWVDPKEKVAISENGMYVVRIPPPKTENSHEWLGDVFARIYKFDEVGYKFVQKFELNINSVPISVFISNKGLTIAVDQWGQVGYGPIITVYDADGRILSESWLDDIFTEDEILSMQKTTSSIWWRKNGLPALLDEGENTLFLSDALGGVVEVNMETGNVGVKRYEN